MESVIVEGGLFEVNEAGEVYRLKNGQRELAHQVETGRRKEFLVVSAQVDGKQKQFYVHRLVAEAFIPNPHNYPEVNHIDGNPKNNHVENLRWVSRAQSVQHAYRMGFINPYSNAVKCKICGAPTRAKDEICTACKLDLKSEANKERRLADIRDALSMIDPSKTTQIQLKYVNLRMEGYTIREIAEICGVSPQCVDASIKSAIHKSSQDSPVKMSTRKLILQLESKIKRKQSQLNKLTSTQLSIQKEIEDTQNQINTLKSSVQEVKK